MESYLVNKLIKRIGRRPLKSVYGYTSPIQFQKPVELITTKVRNQIGEVYILNAFAGIHYLLPQGNRFKDVDSSWTVDVGALA